NGTTETRGYDVLDRLTSIVTSGPSGVIVGFTYGYDASDHKLSVLEASGRTDHYQYDSLYRVVQEAIVDPATSPTNRVIGYTYDLVGNRLSKTDSGAPAGQQALSYVYDANDRLQSVTGSAGFGQNFSYDANGSTTAV